MNDPTQHSPPTPPHTFGIFNRPRLRFVRAVNADFAYLSFATVEEAKAYNEANGNIQNVEFREVDPSIEVGN